MDGFGAYVLQLTKTALWRAFSRARGWLFVIVSLALPIAKASGRVSGMSEAQALGLTVVALVGGFALEWALAAFDLHRKQKSEIKALTPPEVDRRAVAAIAFREVLESANEMLRKGTSGCHDGKDAERWVVDEYEPWLENAKARITRDAGPEECTAVFLIGSIRGLEQINGHNAEATRRLTFLKHHMDQLKEGLKRYLPSTRGSI